MWFPKAGETHPVTEGRWVQVANPDGIPNSNYNFEFDDNGRIEIGGSLTVVASDERHGLVLVKYTTRPNPGRIAGTELPSGTLFFLPISEVAEWETLQDCVRRLLRDGGSWALR